MKLDDIVQRAWYENRGWIRALKPLSKVYQREFERRKQKALAERRTPFFIPVIVVGNITVGGTGKTPLIIHLVNRLKLLGLNVVVISRGYGAHPPESPYVVESGGCPELCGDEPLLIAEATGSKVVIDEDRCAAAERAISLGANVILSDDGLQHHALPRAFEIAVVDGSRGLGNRLLLPAGPLREPVERLSEVDYVICNGVTDMLDEDVPVNASFELRPAAWVNVATGTRVPLDFIGSESKVDAVAGIGNPQRFYSTLESLGFSCRKHTFSDHHAYQSSDFNFLSSRNDALVFMTMKDALKCRDFAGPNFWALDVEADFGDAGDQLLIDAIAAL